MVRSREYFKCVAGGFKGSEVFGLGDWKNGVVIYYDGRLGLGKTRSVFWDTLRLMCIGQVSQD